MALQSANNFLAGDAFQSIRSTSAGYKGQAQNALASMQAGPVNADFIFRILDQAQGVITALTQWKAVVGLDAYATSQSYPTALSSDCAAVISSAQAIIASITAAFPATGGFLQAYRLNVDGSRTATAFTSAQTASAGLQTALLNFIATIS